MPILPIFVCEYVRANEVLSFMHGISSLLLAWKPYWRHCSFCLMALSDRTCTLVCPLFKYKTNLIMVCDSLADECWQCWKTGSFHYCRFGQHLSIQSCQKHHMQSFVCVDAVLPTTIVIAAAPAATANSIRQDVTHKQAFLFPPDNYVALSFATLTTVAHCIGCSLRTLCV